MSLCQQCQTISTGTIRLAEGEVTELYTHSAETFNQAVTDGCYFCAKVDRGMPKDVKESMKAKGFPGIRCSISQNDEKFGLGFSIPGKQTVEFFRLGEPFDFEFSEFGNNTDHPNTWARLKTWHKFCKEQHTQCNRYSHDPNTALTTIHKWLPTRLLDTRLSGGEDNDIRIITTATDLTAEERSRASYLVLSHCWGRQPAFLTLTQTNKFELFDSFSTDREDLPRNFRDAIHATRQLGFQYLWIDSLCIIQGKDGDWSSEAPLMDRVYQDAELCLAAAASADAMGGLFRARDPTAISPFKIDMALSSSSSEEVTPRRHSFSVYCAGEVPMVTWGRLIDECPLNTRGWVQQERVLAPRTIHFAEDQVCWECKELQAYEAGPDDAMEESRWEMIKNWEAKGPEAVKSAQVQAQLRLTNDGPKKGEEVAPASSSSSSSLRPAARDMYKAWREIIAQYTSCQLSHESDKLVAASGMAKAFGRHLAQQQYGLDDEEEEEEEEYLAGLWRGRLIYELLWNRARWYRNDTGDRNVRYGVSKDRLTTTRRHKEYRAPSWSWASIDGPVEWANQKRWEEIAVVKSTRVDLIDALDPTMQVKYGEITLQTYLVPQSRIPRGSQVVEIFDVEGEQEQDTRPLFLAPLCISRRISVNQYTAGDVWRESIGLILVEGDVDDDRAKFRRLGLFRATCRVKEWIVEEGGQGRWVEKEWWYGEEDKRDVTVV